MQPKLGWKLISVEGNKTFTFPDGFVLKAGASVQILSGSDAVASDGKLVWTTRNIWNNDGDEAKLFDPN